MHIIHFEQIYSPFPSFKSPSFPLPLLAFLKFCADFLKKNQTDLVITTYIYMVVGSSTG